MLYDGHAIGAPTGVNLVCFTSLDEVRQIDNIEHNTAIYMHVWERKELHDAALALELGLQDDFGEAPSLCLSKDDILHNLRRKVNFGIAIIESRPNTQSDCNRGKSVLGWKLEMGRHGFPF